MLDWREQWDRRQHPESYVERDRVKRIRVVRCPPENHDLRWLLGGACEAELGIRGQPMGEAQPAGERDGPGARELGAAMRQTRLLRALAVLGTVHRAALRQCYAPPAGQQHREAESESVAWAAKWGQVSRALVAVAIECGPLSPGDVLRIIAIAYDAHVAFEAELERQDAAARVELQDARDSGQARNACRLSRLRAGVASKAQQAKDRLMAWIEEVGLGS